MDTRNRDTQTLLLKGHMAETHPRVSRNVHVTIYRSPQAAGPENIAIRFHFQLASIILPSDLIPVGILDIDIRHPNRRGASVVDLKL